MRRWKRASQNFGRRLAISKSSTTPASPSLPNVISQRLVQTVTDAGVQLSHAEFGAFFYNVMREDGEAYTLYTLSGVPREAFAKFPMPRNTAIFEPTFRGRGPVRSDDILADPRYGKNAPHKGMPEGHLPGSELSCGVGRLAVRRSSGWPFLRTFAAAGLYRSGRTDRHRACGPGGRCDR